MFSNGEDGFDGWGIFNVFGFKINFFFLNTEDSLQMEYWII